MNRIHVLVGGKYAQNKMFQKLKSGKGTWWATNLVNAGDRILFYNVRPIKAFIGCCSAGHVFKSPDDGRWHLDISTCNDLVLFDPVVKGEDVKKAVPGWHYPQSAGRIRNEVIAEEVWSLCCQGQTKL